MNDYETIQSVDNAMEELNFYESDYRYYISSPFANINYMHDNYIDFINNSSDDEVF